MLVLVMSLAGLGQAQVDPRQNYIDLKVLLTEGQKQAILHRMLEKEPFLRSLEAKRMRSSMGKYFGKGDYAVLAGNPGLGYYLAPPAFSWPAGVQAVEFAPPKGVDPGTARVRPGAWVKAMEVVARKNQFNVVPKGAGTIKIQGAVVHFDPKVKYPEVTLELKITDAKGVTILYRKTEARPTAGDSVGALLDFMMSFARKFGAGGAHAAH